MMIQTIPEIVNQEPILGFVLIGLGVVLFFAGIVLLLLDCSDAMYCIGGLAGIVGFLGIVISIGVFISSEPEKRELAEDYPYALYLIEQLDADGEITEAIAATDYDEKSGKAEAGSGTFYSLGDNYRIVGISEAPLIEPGLIPLEDLPVIEVEASTYDEKTLREFKRLRN